MALWRHIQHPTRIPVPGDKLIEEFLGRVNGGFSTLSVAHMKAPPGWGEPAQTPRFGELTIMIAGRMRIEVGSEDLELKAGQVFWIEPNTRVRYSNPFAEESEYWAVCLPAFDPTAAGREE